MASYGRALSVTPRKKYQIQTKFERTLDCQNVLHSDILQNQQTDANGDLADTLLICNGGSIRVHAFILQAASPFIQMAVESQGENYPFVREILMPDFSVKEIERMLNLIYKGYVDLQNNQETQSLQETLNFFQILHVDFNKEKINKGINGSLKVQPMNRIPQDIFKNDLKEEKKTSEDGKPAVIVIDASTEKQAPKPETPAESTDGQQQLRRSRRAPKPIAKPGKKTGKGKTVAEGKSDEESDYKANSGEESSNEEPSDDEGASPRKRGKSQLKLRPVVKLPRLMNTVQQSAPNSPSSAVGSTRPTSLSVPTTPISSKSGSATPISSATTPACKDDENCEIDEEDEDWVKPNFNDKKWLALQTRRCQTCNKTFSKPADASLCVTSHKSLRCYFCFRTYSTTDILFRHFKRRHRQAGRESTLICPFCDQSVPYKSVSCHVISLHLKTLAQMDSNDESGNKSQSTSPASSAKSVEVRKGPGRPPTTPIVTSPSTSSQGSLSGSASKNNNHAGKVSNGTSTTKQAIKKKKKKGTQLKLGDMKKMLRKADASGELKVRDLDVTLEKVTPFGRTITFRLQKKRLEEDARA